LNKKIEKRISKNNFSQEICRAKKKEEITLEMNLEITLEMTLEGFCLCSRPLWQGVSTDSLKFFPGLPCPTLLCPAGGPPMKQLYSNFWSGPPAGRTPCSCLLPPWVPHVIWACFAPRCSSKEYPSVTRKVLT
jgi:hypothetical protein